VPEGAQVRTRVVLAISVLCFIASCVMSERKQCTDNLVALAACRDEPQCFSRPADYRKAARCVRVWWLR
jgi:hypothetical protein